VYLGTWEADDETPPLLCLNSNPTFEPSGTVLSGQFDWGDLLLKGNGGVQRYPQPGWQSGFERKGIRVLDCESDGTSRDESRP
jgi:hypothetical protein